MLYSKTTNILTFNGWHPLVPNETIIHDLIVLNERKKRIVEIEGEINIVPKQSHGFIYLRNEYIDTIVDRDSEEEASTMIIATDRTETFSEFKSWTFDEIYILGLILTDAYYNQSGGIEIYQSAKKKSVVERIDATLSNLGYKGSLGQRDRNGKHYTWRIAKESADHFKSKFDLPERGNPSVELIFLEQPQRRQLLSAMMDGDGTWNNLFHDYGVFYKPQIIDFFQILAMSLGYKCKINHHRKQIYISLAGYGAYCNATEPDMELHDKRTEFLSIERESNSDLWRPILKDNGKIFMGGTDADI